jgi:hypothetical protein
VFFSYVVFVVANKSFCHLIMIDIFVLLFLKKKEEEEEEIKSENINKQK